MSLNLKQEGSGTIATPASGRATLFIDSADENLKKKLPDGSIVEIESAGAVDSVFGRTGVVVAVTGDYNASQVSNTPAGNIVATTVQAAINELDTEKLTTAHQGAGGISEHPVATGSVAGFMSPSDKTKLDGIASGATSVTLSNVAPNAIGVASAGVSTEASRQDHVHAHGNQAGGSLHADATTSIAGFLSASDKTKLDGIAVAAAAVSASAPSSVGTANSVGVGTSAARFDHVHDHGSQSTPSHHAVATATDNGFMSSTDKAYLDGLATVATSADYNDLINTPASLPPSGAAGGELSGTYPNPTLVNSAVIAKVLTGLSAGPNVVAATDTILQAFNKLVAQSTLTTNTVSTSVTVPDDYVWMRANRTFFSGSITVLLTGTGRIDFV